MRSFKIILVAFTAFAAPAFSAEEGWMNLTNGKDLTGWVQHGGKARYSVEDGAIVGTSILRTENSFLCTEKTYGDFVLEYDFKVDPRLNSGVQIRSECFDEAKKIEWKGKTINIAAGRVHGYQVEIDPDVPRKRMWSAGIYDEGRRGWLFPSDGEQGKEAKAFSEQGLRIFKPNDWNRVRVEAIGDSIKTWLNGTPCAAIKDSMTPKGFVALQVHGIGSETAKEGTQVRWRSLRIKEVASGPLADGVKIQPASGVRVEVTSALNTLSDQEKKDGWRLLWDGQTSQGWRNAGSETFPARGWEMKDGVLTVLESGNPGGTGGDIITRERFANFELLVDFRITQGANSGIKYFVQPNLNAATGAPAAAGRGSALGLEYQVLDDERHPDAKLGRNGDRTQGSLYDLLPAAASKKSSPIGEWNTARIISRGNHVEHWLNGDKVLEYERGSAAYREAVALSKFKPIPGFGEWPDGHILLQGHGDRVSFRNLKIRVLPAS
jgi:hypothetical protein